MKLWGPISRQETFAPLPSGRLSRQGQFADTPFRSAAAGHTRTPPSRTPSRRTGWFVAREHRDSRPTYSLQVFYSAGRPALSQSLCLPHHCGRALTTKIGQRRNGSKASGVIGQASPAMASSSACRYRFNASQSSVTAHQPCDLLPRPVVPGRLIVPKPDSWRQARPSQYRDQTQRQAYIGCSRKKIASETEMAGRFSPKLSSCASNASSRRSRSLISLLSRALLRTSGAFVRWDMKHYLRLPCLGSVGASRPLAVRC